MRKIIAIAIAIAVAALALSGCASTGPTDELLPTPTETETEPPPWVANDPYKGWRYPDDPRLCEGDNGKSEFYETSLADSEILCPERVKQQKAEKRRAKAMKKKRIEIWGYDPGPGGINDSSGSSSRCVYSPTMNWDWHDDMVCDGVRLYLLPNDDYVTRDELERAAREWAASHS